MKSIFTNQDEELVKRKSFPNKEIFPATGDHMKIKKTKFVASMKVSRWISSLSKGKVSLLKKARIYYRRGKISLGKRIQNIQHFTHCIKFYEKLWTYVAAVGVYAKNDYCWRLLKIL